VSLGGSLGITPLHVQNVRLARTPWWANPHASLAQRARSVMLVLEDARCAMQGHSHLGSRPNARVAKLVHTLTGDSQPALCVRPTPTARLERVAVSRAPRLPLPKRGQLSAGRALREQHAMRRLQLSIITYREASMLWSKEDVV